MRVIGGRLGGQPLMAPRGRATRPTPERVREALFSLLGALEGDRVLDLFAGSGALGIEALSRGASSATLVDSSPGAVSAIRRNLVSLRINADVHRRSATGFLRSARQAGRQYDLVFLDPPYRHAASLGRSLSDGLLPVLSASARVVAESDRREPLTLAGLSQLDERRYGDTLIRLYGT